MPCKPLGLLLICGIIRNTEVKPGHEFNIPFMKRINPFLKQIPSFRKKLIDMMIFNLTPVPGIDSTYIHYYHIGSHFFRFPGYFFCIHSGRITNLQIILQNSHRFFPPYIPHSFILHQPLTAPAATPLIIFFCNKKYKIKIGIIVSR